MVNSTWICLALLNTQYEPNHVKVLKCKYNLHLSHYIGCISNFIENVIGYFVDVDVDVVFSIGFYEYIILDKVVPLCTERWFKEERILMEYRIDSFFFGANREKAEIATLV